MMGTARRQDRPAISDGKASSRRVAADSIVRPNSEARDGRGLPPTLEASAELQYAFSFFNDALYGSRLPDCQITYTRRKHVLGHFYPDRFQRSNGVLCHEIALNPLFLALRGDRDTLSTLVHEICHLWRHEFGPLNRRGGRGSNGYHDRAWADEM